MISRRLTHPITRPRKPAPVSDPQRSRLYKLEREFVGSAVYSSVRRQDLQTVTDHVCRYYQVPTIKVVVYTNKKAVEYGYHQYWEFSDGTRKPIKIALNRGHHGATLAVLMHELAHHISDYYYDDHESHGPEFTGIYMHLLDKYRILPSIAFRALAKKWRVRIARRFRPAALRA